MTLIDFLTARLDEDRDAAHGDRNLIDGAHFSRKRILREVAAKRAVLVEHCYSAWDYCCPVCGADGQLVRAPCPTIRAIAAVYLDHPDYLEEWV